MLRPTHAPVSLSLARMLGRVTALELINQNPPSYTEMGFRETLAEGFLSFGRSLWILLRAIERSKRSTVDFSAGGVCLTTNLLFLQQEWWQECFWGLWASTEDAGAFGLWHRSGDDFLVGLSATLHYFPVLRSYPTAKFLQVLHPTDLNRTTDVAAAFLAYAEGGL